jgi:hypothetical protein
LAKPWEEIASALASIASASGRTRFTLGYSQSAIGTMHHFPIMLSKGLIPGWARFRGSGSNADVDMAAEEDIWNVGGALTYLASVETLTVESSSANDTSAGTGARTVIVEGLDSTYAEISETVTMNGTTQVTTANSYIRLHRLSVATAGSGATNAGTITVKPSVTTAATQGAIQIGEARSRGSHFTVPLGKNAFFMSASLSIGKAAGTDKNAEIKAWLRPFGGVFQLAERVELSTSSSSFVTVELFAPSVLAAKTDIKFTCSANQNDTLASCFYDLALVDA